MENSDMKKYIETDSLWQCKTCFHNSDEGCSPDIWCDHGESYRPAYNKFMSLTERDIIVNILNRIQRKIYYEDATTIEFANSCLNEDINIDFDEDGNVIDIYC